MAGQDLGLPPQDRGLYKLLYKRLKLPRETVHGLMTAVRRRRLGGDWDRRFALVDSIGDSELALDPDAGWRIVPAGDSAPLARLAANCRAVFDAYRDAGQADEALCRNPKKRFLLSVLSGNEFLDHPKLVHDMVDRSIVDAAAAYLGAIPRLEGAALWWTPPNDTADSSQMWHIDELADRQVKILVNCTDVGLDCGPLHFLPAARSDSLRAQMRHKRGRIDENALQRLIDEGEVRALTGPPGTAAMLDSSRCLHFGSRGNERERLVLAFHFFAPSAPVDSRYHLEMAAFDGVYADLDEIQRLALGWTAAR